MSIHQSFKSDNYENAISLAGTLPGRIILLGLQTGEHFVGAISEIKISKPERTAKIQTIFVSETFFLKWGLCKILNDKMMLCITELFNEFNFERRRVYRNPFFER